MVIRKLVLAPGPYADTDWTDPTVPIPDNARRFKITGDMVFAVYGRATTAPDAPYVSLGVMTLDAYVLVEGEGGRRSRGKSVVEVETDPLDGQVMISSRGLPLGSTARLHLTLAAVSAPVVDVELVSGGRVL